MLFLIAGFLLVQVCEGVTDALEGFFFSQEGEAVVDGGADGGSGDGDAKGLGDFSHGEIVLLAELFDNIVQGLWGPVVQVG